MEVTPDRQEGPYKVISRYVRQWLDGVLSMWRAMFLPWRVGCGGWLVAWFLGVLGGLPGALVGLSVAGKIAPHPAGGILLLGVLIGAVLGSAVGELAFTLPFALGALLQDWTSARSAGGAQSGTPPSEGQAAAGPSSDHDHHILDEAEAPLDPQTFALAPDAWQPKAEQVAAADTIPLPLTLRQRQSPLRVLRMLVIVSLPWLVLFEVTGTCDQGVRLFTVSAQLVALDLAAFFGVLSGAAVYLLILLMSPLKHQTVLADHSGLAMQINGRPRFVHWQDICAWTVSQHQEIPLGVYGPWREYTLWTIHARGSDPYPSLIWQEYEHLALAGLPGIRAGHAAYRERADALHALIAAHTHLPLRLESEDSSSADATRAR